MYLIKLLLNNIPCITWYINCTLYIFPIYGFFKKTEKVIMIGLILNIL